MVRAEIPIWYTEGFNPHPKMVFAQPLPLFVESRCELLDIKLEKHMESGELVRRLREAFTAELYVNEVYVPQEKFSQIDCAGYEIYGISPDESKIADLLRGGLMALKKTKDGEKTIDITSMIKSFRRADGGGISCILDASASSYLNPEVFCRGVISALGLPPDTDFSVIRTGWYKKDLSVFR